MFSLQKAREEIHCPSVDRHLSNTERKLEKVLQDQEVQTTRSATEENSSHEKSSVETRSLVDDLETAQEVDTFCIKKICCKGIN